MRVAVSLSQLNQMSLLTPSFRNAGGCQLVSVDICCVKTCRRMSNGGIFGLVFVLVFVIVLVLVFVLVSVVCVWWAFVFARPLVAHDVLSCDSEDMCHIWIVGPCMFFLVSVRQHHVRSLEARKIATALLYCCQLFEQRARWR